tara:strand:- start:10873 stop:11550 length:678 start_codon:yes stop_codon:yes gene_type:complete
MVNISKKVLSKSAKANTKAKIKTASKKNKKKGLKKHSKNKSKKGTKKTKKIGGMDEEENMEDYKTLGDLPEISKKEIEDIMLSFKYEGNDINEYIQLHPKMKDENFDELFENNNLTEIEKKKKIIYNLIFSTFISHKRNGFQLEDFPNIEEQPHKKQVSAELIYNFLYENSPFLADINKNDFKNNLCQFITTDNHEFSRTKPIYFNYDGYMRVNELKKPKKQKRS